MARWIKAHAPATRVVGISSRNASAMHDSWKAGRIIEHSTTHTIADGIAIRVPIPEAVADMKGVVDDVLLVHEASILTAMKLLFEDERMMLNRRVRWVLRRCWNTPGLRTTAESLRYYAVAILLRSKSARADELNPQRTIRELNELRDLTGDENGAQRVAWTSTWRKAREWYQRKLGELPVTTHRDAAGNVWSTLPGESDKALLLGGHLDSVPNGGWLDGCLGTVSALEVMRAISSRYKGRPPFTISLVDWADEEGARFGRSLFGSSAFAGTHTMRPIALAWIAMASRWNRRWRRTDWISKGSQKLPASQQRRRLFGAAH